MRALGGDQGDLFEPSGADVGPLALAHVRKAGQFRRAAEVFEARWWQELSHQHLRRSLDHDIEAECLGMLADLERFGGVVS